MSEGTARLEVVAGRAVGMSIIVDSELVIGRQAAGAGRLADDDEISRSHARVSVDSSGFCEIEDLGSTNGTFVNGLRISSPQTVSEGDSIELGATTLVVRELPAPGQAVAPEQAVAPAVPQPTVVPEPSPAEPLAAEPTAPARVSLAIEIDFDAQEAQLRINEAADPLRLGFDGASWSVIETDQPEGEPSA